MTENEQKVFPFYKHRERQYKQEKLFDIGYPWLHQTKLETKIEEYSKHPQSRFEKYLPIPKITKENIFWD